MTIPYQFKTLRWNRKYLDRFMPQTPEQLPEQQFDDKELDILVRKIISRVRTHYLQHGEKANRIPAELKKIIDDTIGRF